MFASFFCFLLNLESPTQRNIGLLKQIRSFCFGLLKGKSVLFYGCLVGCGLDPSLLWLCLALLFGGKIQCPQLVRRESMTISPIAVV